MQQQTPDEWLADFERKVADLQQRATAFKSDIDAAGVTHTSPDGAITVTVAPSGALTDLRIADSALTTGATLAEAILTLTRQARRQAATNVATAFTPLGGTPNTVQHIPDPTPNPPQHPKPPTPTQDDDFTETVVLRDVDNW